MNKILPIVSFSLANLLYKINLNLTNEYKIKKILHFKYGETIPKVIAIIIKTMMTSHVITKHRVDLNF